MTRRALSPQAIAQKWQRNTAGSVESYKAGVNAVTVAPGQAAAAAVDRMIEALIAKRDSGELAEAMASVPLEIWKKLTIDKGAGRIAQGVSSAVGDMEMFMQEFLPYAQNVANSLPARGNLEENINRMVLNVRGLKGFKRSRRRAR